MNEIIKSSLVNNAADLQTVAQIFVKSGFFQDTADISKAQVKIMAGREIGLEPFASMSGIHVIKGKVTYGANIQAAKVKGSGRYDYRVREMTDKACRIMFYQLVSGKWEEIGLSEFTIEDARKAQTQNLDKFARNMLFARAISNGVKWFCPDVTGGVTMYAPEEFGATVNDEGNIIEVDGKPVTVEVISAQTSVIATPEPEPLEPHYIDAAFPPQASAADHNFAILDADRKGTITIPLILELGLTDNEFSARNMLKAFSFTEQTPAAQALPVIRKYRAFKDSGKMTTKEAVEAALK